MTNGSVWDRIIREWSIEIQNRSHLLFDLSSIVAVYTDPKPRAVLENGTLNPDYYYFFRQSLSLTSECVLLPLYSELAQFGESELNEHDRCYISFICNDRYELCDPRFERSFVRTGTRIGPMTFWYDTHRRTFEVNAIELERDDCFNMITSTFVNEINREVAETVVDKQNGYLLLWYVALRSLRMHVAAPSKAHAIQCFSKRIQEGKYAPEFCAWAHSTLLTNPIRSASLTRDRDSPVLLFESDSEELE